MKGKDGVQFIIPEGADTMIPKVRAHMHRLAVERCTEDRHVAISPAMLRSSDADTMIPKDYDPSMPGFHHQKIGLALANGGHNKQAAQAFHAVHTNLCS